MTQSIADEVPNGLCARCGMFLLNTSGKQKTCVNCDIKSEPSGVVNDLEDPGHEAMGKIMSSALSTVPVITKEVAPPSPAQIKVSNLSTAMEPLELMKLIQVYFSQLPITDLNQAKALLKIRKDIDILSEKIHKFIGELK